MAKALAEHAAAAAAATQPERPSLFTVSEAAEIFKCSPNWLRDQARRRRIPHTMIGGSYHFTGAHLEAAIRLFERPAEPESQPRTYVARAPEKSVAVDAQFDVPLLRARVPRGPRKKPSR